MKHLSAKDVRALHAIALELDGGTPGERDPGGLEVFGQPLHPTLEEVAAAYLFHLCQAHAFVDGNKRTALAAMLVFLHLNGFRLRASDIELFNLVLGVARGELEKTGLSVRLRDWLEPHSKI